MTKQWEGREMPRRCTNRFCAKLDWGDKDDRTKCSACGGALRPPEGPPPPTGKAA